MGLDLKKGDLVEYRPWKVKAEVTTVTQSPADSRFIDVKLKILEGSKKGLVLLTLPSQCERINKE